MRRKKLRAFWRGGRLRVQHHATAWNEMIQKIEVANISGQNTATRLLRLEEIAPSRSKLKFDASGQGALAAQRPGPETILERETRQRYVKELRIRGAQARSPGISIRRTELIFVRPHVDGSANAFSSCRRAAGGS
jgi:hypothetical protein